MRMFGCLSVLFLSCLLTSPLKASASEDVLSALAIGDFFIEGCQNGSAASKSCKLVADHIQEFSSALRNKGALQNESVFLSDFGISYEDFLLAEVPRISGIKGGRKKGLEDALIIDPLEATYFMLDTCPASAPDSDCASFYRLYSCMEKAAIAAGVVDRSLIKDSRAEAKLLGENFTALIQAGLSANSVQAVKCPLGRSSAKRGSSSKGNKGVSKPKRKKGKRSKRSKRGKRARR